jgi:hypothetical protein
MVTPKSPIANSEVERLMVTVGQAYKRAQILNPNDWKTEILNAVKAQRCTPHPDLKMSPYEIVFGRKMRPANFQIAPWLNETPRTTTRFETAAERLYLSKEKRKMLFEQKKNVRPHEFRVGDRVWCIPDKDTKSKSKTYDPDLYQVTFVRGTQVQAQNLKTNRLITRHSSHFKMFVPPFRKNNSDDDENDNDKRDQTNEIDNNNQIGLLDLGHRRAQLAQVGGNENDMRAQRAQGGMNNDQNLRADAQGGRRDRRQNRGVQFEDVDQIRHYEQEPENAMLPRQLRSRGPAPEIPNVLPANPYRSRELQRDLREIHIQHAQQQAQPPRNAP